MTALCKSGKGKKWHLTSDTINTLCGLVTTAFHTADPEQFADKMCRNCRDLWDKGIRCEPRHST